MKRVIAINDRGYRVGEDHQKAKLTDSEVETIRELHRDGLNYRVIAVKFEISKHTVARICRYERRAETATRYKTIED